MFAPLSLFQCNNLRALAIIYYIKLNGGVCLDFALDGRGINLYKGTGIGTYTDNLLRHMLKICENNKFHIFWCGDNYKEYETENSKIILTSKKHHSFFEEQYFPTYLKNCKINLLHVPQNGIGMSKNLVCKKIVTVHDLIPYFMPETVGKGYLNKFLKDMPEIIHCSDAIITVSNASKSDILRFFPGNDKKIHVVPLAADPRYIPLDKEYCKHLLIKEFSLLNPFILYLGGFSPRKNVKAIINAYKKSIPRLNNNYDLVLAGAEKEEVPKIKNLAEELGISERVKFTGFVKEELMPVLYNGCELFIYPSLYEGFGLPPLEAMACNTPVICSNLSSIPEICENGAMLINPRDVEEISSSITKILNNIDIKNNLKVRAEAQAKKFSWSITAKKTLELYSSI